MSDEYSTMDAGEAKGCGCAACQDDHHPQVIGYAQDENVQPGNDTVYAPTNDASPETFANYLTHGYWGGSSRTWASNNITYSLSNEFTAAQKAGITMAFDLWADVADITFTEVGGSANMTIVEGDDGRAYSSSGLMSNGSGDFNITSNTISIDTNIASWRNFDDIGDYALMTALHEIGHSLGLGHTGDYNGSASYANDAQWTNDSHQMTVMSYFNDQNVGSDHYDSNSLWQYSATPMLIDVVAIQNLYGANNSARIGNTTYGFNSNAGRDQYDFTLSEAPIAIWDGGGVDTLDLSGYSTSQTIYLTEGDFSSVGAMTNNMVIAYGSTIENAIGGSGNDTLYGNEFSNTILGGLGNDSFYGSLGDDVVDGQGGADDVIYSYSFSDFTFNFIDSVTVALSHVSQFFTDTITNLESFIFSDGTYTFAELQDNTYDNMITADSGSTGTRGTDDKDFITGNNQNEILRGYAGNDLIRAENGSDLVYGHEGDDVIYGGGWADTIFGDGGWSDTYGGNDTLYGEAGNDRINGRAGNDYIDGGLGHDVLYGHEGEDIIHGGSGADIIFGDFNNLDAVGSNDQLYGGTGSDTITGGRGDDQIFGENGNDLLRGGHDNDMIDGGAGSDRIYGGAGSDTLIGGANYDTLFGEGGSDIFGFTSLVNSTDKVRDFTLIGAERDILNVTDILSGYSNGIDDINDFVILDYKNADQTNLFVNADGVGGDWIKVAEIRGSNFVATSVDDLVASGQLLTDTSLL